jgi:glycerophosphoryl diester phosphodiesterase
MKKEDNMIKGSEITDQINALIDTLESTLDNWDKRDNYYYHLHEYWIMDRIKRMLEDNVDELKYLDIPHGRCYYFTSEQ